MAYLPIEDYGIIGNMCTTALVSQRGSIDWFCIPHFDSPSVFAAILDDKRGGTFAIEPMQSDVTYKQFYLPETNVLISRFLSPEGVAQLEDFMPVGSRAEAGWHDQLVRRVKMSRGSMRFRMRCHPAFDYARAPHTVHRSSQGVVFEGPGMKLELATKLPLQLVASGAETEFVLEEGDSAVFVLHRIDGSSAQRSSPTPEICETLFQSTVAYWRRWISRCNYTGRWREMVHRSALTLKLLTFEPTGAIVAAPTCSLPESIGGVRNWDYRYTWIRDAAFTVYGFLRLGFSSEAAAFMNWLNKRYREGHEDGPLQIMYGIDGRHELPETTLDHLGGYRGSGPVRIGNGASGQFQLDIYGELLDSVYLFNKHGTPISYEAWTPLRSMLDWLCDNWNRADEGIWEVRSGRQQFVYSKLMCWVAMDRGLRLAQKRSFPADETRWRQVRNQIYEDINTHGWSKSRQSFVQAYGSESLDASNLIMPLVFFLSPTDPRMLKTIAAINRPPRDGGLVSDSLVFRYDTDASHDGLPGQEGTFNMCTFWLVEALTRAGQGDPRKLDEARLLFERMLGYANHLGLYAEETSHTGEALGNFPQAFTHLALISAAFNLDRALDKH